MLKKLFNKISDSINYLLDNYFKYALLVDLLIALSLFFSFNYLNGFKFTLLNHETQISVLSYIVDADISLSGFILASLTIIVTFKANLSVKLTLEEGLKPKNGIEMIFSSKHYNSIVSTFKKALIELIFSAIFSSLFWVYSELFSLEFVYSMNIVLLFFTFCPILRCLLLLFPIIGLENLKEEE